MPSSPKKAEKLPFIEALKSDFPASIIVFLVALPLCMGIAIASGAPPATGLITGIVGGIVVGFIAGSPLQVSGPAAGLFVLVADAIETHGTLDGEFSLERGLAAMGIAVLGAGLIQVTAGLCRLGNFFRAVSPAVIQGMLSGIGVLILASQFHVMVDDIGAAKPWLEKGFNKGIANLITIPQSFAKGILPLDGSPHFMAAALGVGTILVLTFWRYLRLKSLTIIPAPVVAVVLASVIAYGLGVTAAPSNLGDDGKPTERENVDDVHITQVVVPDNMAEGIRTPTRDSLLSLLTPGILLSAITIALVASAETMLCATAVDKMQSHARTNYDRELLAQGVGNTICGFLGALPMTGVIVRSSANVDSGGRTRISAILHGVWLLLFVAALPWVLNYIPMAVLAAVLVFTGWRLINPKAIKKLFQVSRAEGAICVITLALVVGVDLLSGVLIGIACAAARLLYTFARLEIKMEESPEDNRTEVHLNGAATFLALPRLTAMLDDVEPATELHVHLEELTYVDHACLELFVNWEKQHKVSGGRLVIDWEDLTASFRSARTTMGRNGRDSESLRDTQTTQAALDTERDPNLAGKTHQSSESQPNTETIANESN